MIRLLVPVLALVATPAFAAPLYRATLAQPVATRAVVKDMLWSCAGAECTAPRTATSSDANVCRSVAKKMGKLTGFAADARSFGAAELEKCNGGAAAN